MNNVGSHLAIKEFLVSDSNEVVLEKLKDMFSFNENFINLYDDEEYYEISEDKEFKSQLEEVFFTFEETISLDNLEKLISKIANVVIDQNDDQYGDFNIVSIKDNDKITIAISQIEYFI